MKNITAINTLTKGWLFCILLPFTIFSQEANSDNSLILTTFEAKIEGRCNVLSWVTFTEFNSDFFTIEKSIDGKNFIYVDRLDGLGTSSSSGVYSVNDIDFENEINYYRLKQTDLDGTVRFSDLVSVDNRVTPKIINKKVNVFGNVVDEWYEGFVIIVYTDDSIEKTVQ